VRWDGHGLAPGAHVAHIILYIFMYALLSWLALCIKILTDHNGSREFTTSFSSHPFKYLREVKMLGESARRIDVVRLSGPFQDAPTAWHAATSSAFIYGIAIATCRSIDGRDQTG
jgi:hypothetical protein